MKETAVKKIVFIFGTRPEAIKLCPVIKEFKKINEKNNKINIQICLTGQHADMLDSVLDTFSLDADHRFLVMQKGQSLAELNSSVFLKVGELLDKEKPDLVFVHGDTATAFASALACFFRKIPIAHVEAGLRTYELYSPYPEEFNRRAISCMASFHFAPTEAARENLLREGIDSKDIFVTGNTVIDALRFTVKEGYSHSLLDWAEDSKLIIITAHRRESLGEPMRKSFRAIRRIFEERKDIKAIYPVHPNPAVRRIAEEELSGCERIKIIEPLDVLDFHNFLARCYCVLTDSGGIQEEAIFFHKPILLMRESTERPEGVEAGGVVLVGNEEEKIYRSIELLLDNDLLYQKMADAENPYGDGRASERIVRVFG